MLLSLTSYPLIEFSGEAPCVDSVVGPSFDDPQPGGAGALALTGPPLGCAASSYSWTSTRQCLRTIRAPIQADLPGSEILA
jgi:hypothetical protein